MPTLVERISAAYKALRFPQTSQSSVAMFSNMNTFQAAIARAVDLDNENPAQSSLVFSGIRWLGNRLPEADIEVRQPSQASDLEEETEAVPDHPMVEKWNRANRAQSGSTLMKAFAYSWILSGDVYFIKFRNSFGQVVEIWYEPHWNVKPRWVDDAQGAYIPFSDTSSNWIAPGKRADLISDFITYFEIDRGSTKFRLETEDVIHFQDGIDPNYPRCGLSGLTTLLREITGDAQIADYYTNILGSGGMPPYAVSIDPSLDLEKEDVMEISDGLKRLKVGQPAVISGAKFEKLGFNPKEMDNRVARYLSEERFSAVTGIPLECLNLGAAGEHSTYNNVTEANRQGVQEVLVPLWSHIGDTLTIHLYPDFDTTETRYVDFDLTHVKALQESEDDKAKRVREDYAAGIITRGEARCARGYPEDEKVDDVYYKPVGGELVPADYVTPDPQEAPIPQQIGGDPIPFGKPEPVVAAKTMNIAYRLKDAQGMSPDTVVQVTMNKAEKSVLHLANRDQQEKARESWERHAPERLKGLISAKGR